MQLTLLEHLANVIDMSQWPEGREYVALSKMAQSGKNGMLSFFTSPPELRKEELYATYRETWTKRYWVGVGQVNHFEYVPYHFAADLRSFTKAEIMAVDREAVRAKIAYIETVTEAEEKKEESASKALLTIIFGISILLNIYFIIR